jgi:hypothetical protein
LIPSLLTLSPRGAGFYYPNSAKQHDRWHHQRLSGGQAEDNGEGDRFGGGEEGDLSRLQASHTRAATLPEFLPLAHPTRMHPCACCIHSSSFFIHLPFSFIFIFHASSSFIHFPFSFIFFLYA